MSKVGLVLICYGVFDAICSIGFGPIMKALGGRIPIFILGAIINFATIIGMLLWQVRIIT